MRYIIATMIFYVNIHAQIVLSEIMYNPEEDESINEFIEIVNTSPVDTIDLSSWLICDKSGCDQIEAFSMDTKLPPESYGIIFGGGYSISEGIYQETIPESAALFRVDDSRIGNGLGNETDSIYVYDPSGIQILAMEYLNSASEGYSLEKIRLENGDSFINWIESLDSLGTPGAINSVNPLDIDVSIEPDSIWHEPFFPKPNEDIFISVVFTNRGNQTVSGNVTAAYEDTFLAEQTFSGLKSGESSDVTLTIPGLEYGENYIDIMVFVSGDMDIQNNSISHVVEVSHPFGIVALNEFLCEPGFDQSEFVELFSFEPINLKNWSIRDGASIKHIPEIEVEPGQFILIAADSGFQSSVNPAAVFAVPTNGFPALNNDGDKIAIYDQTGLCVDSLTYSAEWPIEPERSTEKYRPEYSSADSLRWGISVNPSAMTPGSRNSLYYDTIPENGKVKCYPNPFSPDNDGKDDLIFFHCKFPYEQVILKIEIFDMAGRTVTAPCWNQYTAQEVLVSWDGRRKDNSLAKIGVYLVKTTAKDVSSGEKWEDVQTIVLAKKL